jgi:pre-mRNA-processing factor 17
MDAHSFLQQQRTFAVHGYALNPSAVSNDPSSTYVGNVASAAENNFALIENIKGTHMSRRENKRKRQGKGDAGVVDGDGAYLGPWAGWEGEKEEGVEELEEDAEEWRAEKRRREEQQEATREKMKKAGEEKSIFHGQHNPSYIVVQDLLAHSEAFPRQASRSPTMLEERICTSLPIWVSISSRTKIPLPWRASSRRLAHIPG